MDLFEPAANLLEGVQDPSIFKAVFLAGSPGSGKTTLAHRIFEFRGTASHTGLKMSNIDNVEALFRRQNRSGDYDAYWQRTRAQRQQWIEGRIGLLIDGTGKQVDRISHPKNQLERLGYECVMLYVSVPVEVATQRAASRSRITSTDRRWRHFPEDPQEGSHHSYANETYTYQDGAWVGRYLDPASVERTHSRVDANRDEFRTMFGDRFFEVDNTHPLGDGELAALPAVRFLRRWANPSYRVRNPAADAWRDQQLGG